MLNKAKLGILILGLVLLALAEPSPSQQPAGNGKQPVAQALPSSAIHRLGTSKWRHGSRILCLSYSPNGRILAAGGGDDPVRLWDTDTGTELRNLPEPWVNAMAWSARGSVLVTAGAFKTIRLWAAATGKEIAQIKGHTTAIKSLAISPPVGGTLLASGGQDGALMLWEFDTRQLITKFEGHTDEINALAFSPNNKRLASAGGDRTIRVWDTDNTRPVRHFDGQCAIYALVFVDNKTLASGGDDNVIRLWDADSGKLLGKLEGHQGTVASLLMAHDEDNKTSTLISGAHDKTVRLWDVPKRAEIAKILRNGGDGDALALSQDGKLLASAGLNNTVRRWELSSRKELEQDEGHKAPVTAVAIAPDGKLLASASTLGEVRVWNAAAGKQIKQWGTTPVGEQVLAFAPDNKTIATAAGTDAVRLWDAVTGVAKQTFAGPPDDPVLSLAFGTDGKSLAVGHRGGAIRVWSIADNKIVHQLKYNGPVHALAYAADGKTLAASGGNQVGLYDASNGQTLRAFGPKEGPLLPVVASIAFSPDGKVLATGSYDAIIRLWDTAEGKELGTLEGHLSVVYALAFSTDGRNLVSGSFDKTVRLWETFIERDEKGKRLVGANSQIAVWKGHLGAATSVAMSPDGRTAISGGADTSLVVWDITALSPAGKLPALNLGAPELQTFWNDLATEDIPRGNRALWNLVAGAVDSVPSLDRSVFLLDPDHLTKLLKDLDDKVFRVRDNASKELAKYGRWVEGTLRLELKKNLTEEARRRVDALLQKLDVKGSITLEQERLRYRRTMLALEQIGTAEARQILTKMSRGGPEAPLREEAQASLDRLAKRAAQ